MDRIETISRKANVRLSVTLGLTQTIAWASSYYLPAILARPMANELSIPVSTVYAAFSLSLMTAALTNPFAGRFVDKWGGKPMLTASNICFAVSLFLLSRIQSALSLFSSWMFLGIACGMGLYDMAFSAVVRSRGREAPAIIVGITLFAGFASTVGWPISQYFTLNYGWRQALLAWSCIHILLVFPLNMSLVLPMHSNEETTESDSHQGNSSGNILSIFALAGAFVFINFAAGGLSSHIPELLRLSGINLAVSITVSAAIGPAQVAARLSHMFGLNKLAPASIAIMASFIMPLGIVLMLLIGPALAWSVGIAHGFGLGFMSILKGILPLSIFGDKGYGRRQGLLFLPAGIIQSLSPYLFSLCIDAWGGGAFYVYIAAVYSAGMLFICLKWLTSAKRMNRGDGSFVHF